MSDEKVEIQENQQGGEERPDALEEQIAASPEKTAAFIRELRNENAKWRKAFRDVEARLKSYEEAERQRSEQEAIQRGEWQKLAEQARAELDAAKREVERLAVYESKVKDLLQERLKKIPEGMRSRVPKFDNPLLTLEWLEANADLFTVKPPSLDQSGIVGQKPRIETGKVSSFIRVAF